MERAKNYLCLSHRNITVPEVFPSSYFYLSCRSSMISDQPGFARVVMAAGNKDADSNFRLGSLALL